MDFIANWSRWLRSRKIGRKDDAQVEREMSWLVDFVKEKEGFRANAYQDAVGVWTIGYGSTHGVKQGDQISPANAEKLLQKELDDFKRYVENYSMKVTYYWEPHQIDALTSFVFNLGKGRLNQLTQDGTRTDAVIAEKMKLYVNAGGKPLPGLITRRQEESDHFKGED